MRFFPWIGLALVSAATALEPCSANSTLPCSCPPGTTYAESGTYVIMGAGAQDFFNVVGDFFNTSWRGISPVSTSGTDNKPGALRTLTMPTTKGAYNVTERLTQYAVAPNGAFQIKFEQAHPIKFRDGSGQMAGYWVTFQSDNVFPDQSPSGYSGYSCHTGHPIDFISVREAAYNKATDILKQQGHLNGKTLGPLSAETFKSSSKYFAA